MSPRCYPPEPEFGADRLAEQRVWEALREQLPDEAALLYSVPMIERTADYEADLVIAWPGEGVAMVEVKGGQVSRNGGRWYQSSGGQTHPMKKDPVVQAQDCKHVLHRLLAERDSEAAAARSAHLVAFPFTDIGAGWSYAERPVVVLAVNGLKDQARAREYLYVRLSRARSCLVACGDLEQIAAAGGEGIRRRLQTPIGRRA